jgi:hypothetical protein
MTVRDPAASRLRNPTDEVGHDFSQLTPEAQAKDSLHE